MLEEKKKKKKVLFTGSHRMPVAALGGSCSCLGMFAGKTWPTQSEEKECESKSGRSRGQTTWIRGGLKG